MVSCDATAHVCVCVFASHWGANAFIYRIAVYAIIAALCKPIIARVKTRRSRIHHMWSRNYYSVCVSHCGCARRSILQFIINRKCLHGAHHHLYLMGTSNIYNNPWRAHSSFNAHISNACARATLLAALSSGRRLDVRRCDVRFMCPRWMVTLNNGFDTLAPQRASQKCTRSAHAHSWAIYNFRIRCVARPNDVDNRRVRMD